MRVRVSWLVTIVIVVAIMSYAGLIGLRKLARSRSTQLFGEIIARVETTEHRVALTFDDGPTDALVDSVVRILSERQVNATFFTVGRSLEESPLAGEKLVLAGHELGNHSYSHERMVFRSQDFIGSEIARTDSLILAAGHRGPIFFRPPYGAKLFTLPWYLARNSRTTIMCDVEPDSYREVSATVEGIIEHVLEHVRPGSIILLHIWYPSRRTSLESVGPLVDSLQARGYMVGTIGELLQGLRRE